MHVYLGAFACAQGTKVHPVKSIHCVHLLAHRHQNSSGWINGEYVVMDCSLDAKLTLAVIVISILSQVLKSTDLIKLFEDLRSDIYSTSHCSSS